MERGKNTKGGRTCSTRCQDFQQSNNYKWYWYKDRQINGGKIWTIQAWTHVHMDIEVSLKVYRTGSSELSELSGSQLSLWPHGSTPRTLAPSVAKPTEVTSCRELALWLLHENRPAEAPQFEILLAYNKWINLCNNKTWVKIICNWKLWLVQTSIKQEE